MISTLPTRLHTGGRASVRRGCRARATLSRPLRPASRWLLAVAILLFACDDPLAPNARNLLRPPVTSSEQRLQDDIDHTLGVRREHLRLLPSTEIVVEVESEWTSYQASVIEVAFVPDTGHYESVSRGRRILRAWRDDRATEAFVVGGGQFPGSIGPYYREDDPYWREGHRPWGVLFTDGRAIRGVGGEADMQRLVIGDECPWNWQVVNGPDPRDTTWRSHVTCEHAEFAVTIRGEFSDWDTEGRQAVGRRTPLRIMMHRISGLLITITCDNGPISESLGCGEWQFAPNPCVRANPRRPQLCDSAGGLRADTAGAVQKS